MENSLSSKNEFVKWSIRVKQQDFYIERQLSYKNTFCNKTDFLHKKAAFLQKYIL